GLGAGATIAVSAGGTAHGGAATFSAPHGAVEIGGGLEGSAQAPGDGAALTVDALVSPTLQDIAAIQHEAANNFSGALDVRQRGAGTMTLAAGTTLASHSVTLENDGGAIVLAGTVDASGAQAGAIAVAARDNLTLAPGGLLSVHASGLVSPGGTIDLTTTGGTLTLQAGATVDLGAEAASRNQDIPGGRLTLRAARTGISATDPGGTDVAIAAVGAQVLGASSVDVQALHVYDRTRRPTH